MPVVLQNLFADGACEDADIRGGISLSEGFDGGGSQRVSPRPVVDTMRNLLWSMAKLGLSGLRQETALVIKVFFMNLSQYSKFVIFDAVFFPAAFLFLISCLILVTRRTRSDSEKMRR